MNNWGEDEKSVQELFERCIALGVITDTYGLPDLVASYREYAIPRAVCDFALFHIDGSVTIVEIKRAGLQLREYLTGIGQLMHAAAQFGMAMSATARQVPLRLVLAVPSGVETAIGNACRAANIIYMPFGSVSDHNAISQGIKKEFNNGAQIDRRLAGSEGQT
ncbi:hypothetical protein [Burkholderia multivorans]|uniref:hypothetical protein n=1 Tax=Burkholderia multivorans TaxID=87883 RepID=UPI0006692016|nr:hypothetical protein [Burkholderia multivorans]